MLTQLIGGHSLHEWREIFFAHMQTIDDQFDPGHRIDHIMRVTKTAIELAIQEGAALEVVLPAAILHDTVPVGKFHPDRARASALSAEHSLILLANWDYPANYYPAIQHAILAHSYSANVTPETLEAKVLQDADRLDALGAIGIARTMAAGFRHGNPLYLHSEPFPQKREANDRINILDHFYVKLFRLQEKLNTDAARAEAVRRVRVMEDYLQALAREIGVHYFSFADYCQKPAHA